jgi:hypothetical protein
MPEGTLENETIPAPSPGNGLENWPALPPPFGGQLVPVPVVPVFVGQGAVLGAVWWFEEVTDRSQARTLDGEQRMTRAFQVLTSHPLVGSTTVAAFDQIRTPFPVGCPGFEFNGKPQRRVPQPGDWYVELDRDWNVVHTNRHVVCVDVRAAQTNPENLQEWTVTAEYAGVSDPVAQPASVDFTCTPYQVAQIVEVETVPPNAEPRPILNSAKDPFVEGVFADRNRFTISIQRSVLTWNPIQLADYQNSVNAVTFLAAQHPPGFEPGTCKISIAAVRVRRGGNRDFYWRVNASVEINLDGWDARVRDAGFNYLAPFLGKLPISFHPKWVGKPAPATPQLLTPDGDLADPADPIPAPLTFRVYKRKDWTPLTFLNY